MRSTRRERGANRASPPTSRATKNSPSPTNRALDWANGAGVSDDPGRSSGTVVAGTVLRTVVGGVVTCAAVVGGGVATGISTERLALQGFVP